MTNRGGSFQRAALAVFLLSAAVYAQATGGRLSGTVSDAQGGKVPGVSVVVLNPVTGQSIETLTNERGDYVVPALAPASYRVTVSLAGFKTAVFQNVKIDADVPATLNVTIDVGAVSETVEVTAAEEILQTNSATVSSTLVGRQINELPFVTRNVLELVVTQVGTQTVGTPRTSSINGLPKGSMNISMDGINIQDNLLRSDDGFFATIQPRTDSIEEVSMSTAGLSANTSGAGAAQVKFITKRGTNDFHGGLFWQHRNTALNSNYYFNNIRGLPRDQLILNQGGGHLGGPFLRNKAFFFVNFEGFWLPQSYNVAARVLTPEASQGNFRYRDSTGLLRSVNLLDLARAKNPALPANVRQYPTTIDPMVQGVVNQYLTLATPQAGSLRDRIDSNSDYNRNDFTFQAPGMNRRKFYTARADYNITSKHSANVVWNYQNYYANPDGVNSIFPLLPGTGTVLGHPDSGGTRRISYSVVGAVNSILSPRLTSEVRFGVAPAGVSIFREEITPSLFEQWRGYSLNFVDTGGTNGWIQNPHRANSQSRRHTPVYTLSADLTYSRGAHLWSFGGQLDTIKSWQETLGSASFPVAQFGIVTNDPVNTGTTSLFDTTNFPNSTQATRNDAANLFAALTGRVSQFTRSVGLDETGRYTHTGTIDRNRQREFALFFQDSWKVRPGFTLNYGNRWDVQFPFYNQSGTYTRVGDGVWGVSGPGNLFLPGVLTGKVPEFTQAKAGQYAYKTNWKSFSPSLGLAWSVPKTDAPVLSQIFGSNGQSVFRVGYSIATVREGMNIPISIWGSNQGRSVSSTVTAANFPEIFGPAGSVWFRDAVLPARPEPEQPVYPIAVQAGNSVNEFDPNLRMGYVQSWNISLQRQITPSTVLDIRYVGNHGTTLWRQVNINEVNIFENGFLEEFKIAQQNLILAQRTNPSSTQFAGLAGQQPLPIISTALGLNSDTTFATYLTRGQAGQFATDIANNTTRMGNLTRAGYPINMFRVNPTVVNGGAFIVTNNGHSTYNALQLELRRRLSKGLLAQGSYVWAKSLSNMLASSSSVSSQPTTLRDTNLDKGPSPWDVRHGFKLNFVYELPFGINRRFLASGNSVLGKFVEGWEIAGVTRAQSGTPELLNGRATFNNTTAGQVVLNNMTTKALQDMVKIRKTTGSNGIGIIYFLPQDLIDNTQAAFETAGRTLAQLDRSKPYIGPQTEPGKLGNRVFYYGPWQQRWDLSVIKKTRIGESKSLEFRTQFLNAFNNINFLIGGAGNEVNTQTINTEFGQIVDAYRDITVSGTNDPGGRVIEFMLRVVF